MDFLSAKFLKLHKKKTTIGYDAVWSSTGGSSLSKTEIMLLKIEISDLTDDSLNHWFILFKDFIDKLVIKTTDSGLYNVFKKIILNSENLISYAQKINTSRLPFNLEETLISSLIIEFSEKNINQIKKIENRILKLSKKVFIGTEYSNKYDNAKEILKNVIQNSNLKSVVLNEKEHNEIIDNELYKEMDNCDFGIFDISANNCNVAFEAGYMLGKGKEIILICDDNCFKEIKFDFNHRNMVLFKNDDELKKKLEKRLYSVITKIYI